MNPRHENINNHGRQVALVWETHRVNAEARASEEHEQALMWLVYASCLLVGVWLGLLFGSC